MSQVMGFWGSSDENLHVSVQKQFLAQLGLNRENLQIKLVS